MIGASLVEIFLYINSYNINRVTGFHSLYLSVTKTSPAIIHKLSNYIQLIMGLQHYYLKTIFSTSLDILLSEQRTTSYLN